MTWAPRRYLTFSVPDDDLLARFGAVRSGMNLGQERAVMLAVAEWVERQEVVLRERRCASIRRYREKGQARRKTVDAAAPPPAQPPPAPDPELDPELDLDDAEEDRLFAALEEVVT